MSCWYTLNNRKEILRPINFFIGRNISPQNWLSFWLSPTTWDSGAVTSSNRLSPQCVISPGPFCADTHQEQECMSGSWILGQLNQTSLYAACYDKPETLVKRQRKNLENFTSKCLVGFINCMFLTQVWSAVHQILLSFSRWYRYQDENCYVKQEIL